MIDCQIRNPRKRFLVISEEEGILGEGGFNGGGEGGKNIY